MCADIQRTHRKRNMELSVEALAENREIDLGRAEADGSRGTKESRARVAAYLRIWKMPQSVADELIEIAVSAAYGRIRSDPDASIEQTIMEETERLLGQHLREMFGNGSHLNETEPTEHDRLAILWGGLAEKWRSKPLEPAQFLDEYASGLNATRLTQQPQRLAETQPMVMQTSLQRLPSFRMVGGWFALIALLVLAFIFTR